MSRTEAPELTAQQKPAVEWVGLYNLAIAFLAEETGEAEEVWKARIEALNVGIDQSKPIGTMHSRKSRASDFAGHNDFPVGLAQAFLDQSRKAEGDALRVPWWRPWDRYGCLLGAWLLRQVALALCKWRPEGNEVDRADYRGSIARGMRE